MTDLIVTGITGFLGRHIVDEALARGMYNHIYGISRRWVDQERLSRKWGNRVTMINGDIRNKESVKDIIAKANWPDVIHAAAYKHISMAQTNVRETVDVNITGTQVVLDVFSEYDTRNFVFISTDKACVDYHARVEIGGGEKMPINKIVAGGYAGNVKSFDYETNSFVESQTTNWYKNKLGDREMVAVSYEKSPKHMKYTQRAVVTEDHPVLTKSSAGAYEWVPAGKLTEQTLLVTGEPSCNQKQFALFVGTMLGDAYINATRTDNSKNALVIGHCDKQNEWLELKVNGFSGFNFGKKQTRTKNGRTFHRYTSQRSNFFSDANEDFYKTIDGKRVKILPKNMIHKAIEASLPVFLTSWFLDDGCLSKNASGNHNARIATHGFSQEEVEWLSGLLNGLGIESYPYEITWYNKPYWELRFTTSGTKKLIEIVSPGVPPSMRESKLGGMATHEYDKRFWDLGKAAPYLSYARTHKVVQQKRDVYCIDVENTHNFVVSNIILHNCAPVNVYGQSKAIAEQLVLNAGGTVLRFGNVWGSTGSLVEKWHHEMRKENPVLEITEPTMTRYFYRIADAVDYVLMATDYSECKIVPNLKSTDILLLAEAYKIAYGKSAEIKIIGIRPGEKMHEQMTCPEELSMSFADVVQDKYLRLQPGTFGEIPAGFEGLLGSDKAEQFSIDELVNMINLTKGL